MSDPVPVKADFGLDMRAQTLARVTVDGPVVAPAH
jgi:hypothetical protein